MTTTWDLINPLHRTGIIFMTTTWDPINPSDPYTFTGDDFEAVCVANCLIGEGKTAIQECDTESPRRCPEFLFGGVDEWFVEQFGHTLEESFRTKEIEAATVLDTILYGSAADREIFERSSLTWEEWQERNISSTYNLGRRAKAIAQKIREANKSSA